MQSWESISPVTVCRQRRLFEGLCRIRAKHCRAGCPRQHGASSSSSVCFCWAAGAPRPAQRDAASSPPACSGAAASQLPRRPSTLQLSSAASGWTPTLHHMVRDARAHCSCGSGAGSAVSYTTTAFSVILPFQL